MNWPQVRLASWGLIRSSFRIAFEGVRPHTVQKSREDEMADVAPIAVSWITEDEERRRVRPSLEDMAAVANRRKRGGTDVR